MRNLGSNILTLCYLELINNYCFTTPIIDKLFNVPKSLHGVGCEISSSNEIIFPVFLPFVLNAELFVVLLDIENIIGTATSHPQIIFYDSLNSLKVFKKLLLFQHKCDKQINLLTSLLAVQNFVSMIPSYFSIPGNNLADIVTEEGSTLFPFPDIFSTTSDLNSLFKFQVIRPFSLQLQ